jgi:hypothetical protein
MKCFKATQLVSSGVCQGAYMTGYCAESQALVSSSVQPTTCSTVHACEKERRSNKPNRVDRLLLIFLGLQFSYRRGRV